MTEDKDKAGSAKVNKSGHVKKVTITTNNRIQAGFNSTRRKKAQNQLTNRMHNYQKNTNLFGNVQNVLFHLRLTVICFYSNIGCSESKVIFRRRKKNNNNNNNNNNKKAFTRSTRSHLVYFIQSQSELSQNNTIYAVNFDAFNKQKSPP